MSSIPTAPPAVTPAAAPGPVKPKRKRRRMISATVWAEIRVLYESGDYSQRQLTDFAKTRGLRVSQSAISRRAVSDNWVRASLQEELRKKALESMHAALGDTLRDMLGQHSHEAKVIRSECLKHFLHAAETRKITPHYAMPATILTQLAQTMDRAQLMEARSLGFDYKTGRTVRDTEDEEGAKPTEMTIRVLTPEQEDEIRRKSELGTGEDEEA